MAKAGTPVMASADGRVASSTDLDAGGAKYGKTIQIAHANGLSSVYAHLDRRLVAEGDIVRAGQVIGMSGATGKVTGPTCISRCARERGQSIRQPCWPASMRSPPRPRCAPAPALTAH